MDSKQFVKLCNNKPSGGQIAEWIDALTRGDHTEASLFSGCLHYKPGSNKQGKIPHQAVFGTAGAMYFLDSKGERELLGLWSDRTKKWVASRMAHGYVHLGSTALLGDCCGSTIFERIRSSLISRTRSLNSGEHAVLDICHSLPSGLIAAAQASKNMALEALNPNAVNRSGHWLNELYPGRDTTKAALSLLRDCTSPEVWLQIVNLYDESGGLPPGTLRDALNLMDRFRSE